MSSRDCDCRSDVGRTIPSPAVSQLFLHPRVTRSGYRYDIEHDSIRIVIGSKDPEHDGARALVARGITGNAETVEASTGKTRLRFDIEWFAATRVVERDAGSLSTEPWRSVPSEISHVRSGTRDSKAGDRKVAGRHKQASLIDRGKAA